MQTKQLISIKYILPDEKEGEKEFFLEVHTLGNAGVVIQTTEPNGEIVLELDDVKQLASSLNNWIEEIDKKYTKR